MIIDKRAILIPTGESEKLLLVESKSLILINYTNDGWVEV